MSAVLLVLFIAVVALVVGLLGVGLVLGGVGYVGGLVYSLFNRKSCNRFAPLVDPSNGFKPYK